MSKGKKNAVQSVKGTRDLLPPATIRWARVEAVARRVFATYGFDEIRTPILEHTELFVRGVGESTDIVGKEMYTFPDKQGRSLTLRPESTAAVARAYVQHGLHSWPGPVKLFYLGPHFRYERPQAHRYRQFYQIGAEVLGDAGPWTDVELLGMLRRFLTELGFEGLVVKLNTVGDAEDRRQYATALRAYLEAHRDALGEDSRRRLDTNPLRILDTKLEHEKEILRQAPRLLSSLGPEARRHFEQLQQGLDALGIRYEIADDLVRGLDYYTRTVFEIISEGLGAQNAILGGGRYDRLVAELGGPDVPSIGFAIGEDRLVDVLPETADAEGPVTIAVVPVGEGHELAAVSLGDELCSVGLRALVELSGRSMRAALKNAGKRDCRFVLLLGDDELESGQVTVKDFRTGDQERIDRAVLVDYLTKREEPLSA